MSNVAHDTTEDYPGPPLIAFQKLPLLIERLKSWGLALDISLTSMAEDSVFEQLSSLVAQKSRSNNIVWACRPGSSSSTNTVESEHADSPFIIMCQGRVSANKMSHTLVPFNSPSYDITNAKLSKTMHRFQHPSIRGLTMLAICA